MLVAVGTDDLHFDGRETGALCDVPPRFSGDLERIDGVGNDGVAETQVVLGGCVANAIAVIPHRYACVPERSIVSILT